MIVAGIYETYGTIDLRKVRARDFLNILLPNISKNTAFMEIVRIRATPSNKLTPEERKIKMQYRIKTQANNDTTEFINILSSIAKKVGE